MSHTASLWYTIFFAAVFTLLISLIEIPNKSNAGLQASCQTWQFTLYLAIFTLGNGVAAILASLIFTFPAKLASLSPFLYAFFGVFAFEGVMSNTNITFLDKGVLTVQDWIEKARDNAIAAALVRLGKRQQQDRNRLAAKLMVLEEGELDTYMDNHLGKEIFVLIVASAAAHGPNGKLFKALEFAKKDPTYVSTLVAQLKKANSGP
jgi:hypothetical protein